MVRLDVEEEVAIITINRAEKANALTEVGKRQVADTIIAAGERPDVTALVLIGAGDQRLLCRK